MKKGQLDEQSLRPRYLTNVVVNIIYIYICVYILRSSSHTSNFDFICHPTMCGASVNGKKSMAKTVENPDHEYPPFGSTVSRKYFGRNL